MRPFPCTLNEDRRGSLLVDALLALLLFSVGMLALLRLMSAALVESNNAQYRNQASQLASALVSSMWTGDRSLASLQKRFGDQHAKDYRDWLSKVQAVLPGTDRAALQPVVIIDAQRRVAITLQWQAPSDRSAHQLQVQAIITD
jgi:type IV pilus assembly protein PilV